MSMGAMRFKNFRELRGQFSERFRSNGGYEGFTDPELFGELRCQWMACRNRINELSALPTLTDVQRRERDNHIRLVGMWGRIMRDAAQLAFEKIFVVVAEARLPKDHFLRIANEARQIWKDNDYAQGLPIPDKKRRKAISRMQRRGDWQGFKKEIAGRLGGSHEPL